MQVADIVFPALDIPDSAMRNLLYALTAGFPLALIAGWYFDITKDGIRLTRSTDKELPPLILEDYAMLAVIVFVSGVIAFTLWPEPESDISIEGAVAVLPFEDLEEGSEIGNSFSAEIVAALKRVPGIWVPGLDSSTHFKDADPVTIGNELGVGAVLSGTVHRDADGIEISAEIRGAITGKHILSLTSIVDATDLLQAQQKIVDTTIAAISQSAAERSAGPRETHLEACAPVYDIYLRAGHIAKTPGSRAYEIRAKAVELLREATRVAPDCALAWSGLAQAYFSVAPQFSGAEQFEQGLVPAGAAARRALELDDTLADAWIVLAEIAEQDSRFIDAEGHFLKALFAEPANAMANAMYAESLLARGRVKDGLHYAEEAYRLDPAARDVLYKVSMAARMIGDGDLAIEYGRIFRDLSQQAYYDGFAEIARGHMLNGDLDSALEEYRAYPDWVPEWFLECVEAQRDTSLVGGVKERLQAVGTLEQDLESDAWWVIVCATWLDEADVVLDLLFDGDTPDQITEGYYFLFFFEDAAALRQHPRFRQFVEEEGLLDYWRAVGWSDYCEANGDSFRCR
jgi:TolB-like protein/Tfp pilus assembly protein PilF